MTKDVAISYLHSHIGDDEPVFILRGRDILAVSAIFHWADVAGRHMVRVEKIESALAVAGAFLRYQGPKQLPD